MPDIHIDDKAVAFIANWKKRADEHQRKYTFLSVAIIIAAFLLIVAVFLFFLSANYNRIVAQNMNYVQDSAVQEANQVQRELEHAVLSVNSLAGRYAMLTDFNVGETVEEKLIFLRDNSLFDRIAYIEPDGKDTSLEGIADVSDRAYFKRAISGESGWEMLAKSRVTGKSTVVFYSPIRSGGSITGVMAGFYEQERLEALFSYQLFNYTPVSYLLQGNGTVVARSDGQTDSENMLDWLSRQEFSSRTSFEDILSTINAPDRATVTFSFRDGNKTSVGVLVQFVDNDWMLLSVLPNEVTSRMVYSANRAGFFLVLALLLISLVTVVALVLFLRKQQRRLEDEMTLATNNLKVTVKTDQRQLSIIESLAGVFSGVYYLDLDKDEYTRIKEMEKASLSIPESGSIAVGFAAYVEHYISEDFLVMMREFLDAASLRQRVSENGVMNREYQRADKGWRRAFLIPTETDTNGRLLSIVFAVQTIDREKARELEAKEALQEAYNAVQLANSAKTTFLSNMSHDIRTPMNAIVGMTTIAASHLDDPERVGECLRKITSSSRHLLGLINEVLDMSKIESGRVELSEEDFSLSELMDNLITIHQPLVRERDHSLVVKIRELTHEKVVGDSTRLQQVFTNLLSNAIKYTPDGGSIEITLSEKPTNKPTVGWYEFVISDNGIGMSEEFQKTMFEPFSRADDRRVSKIQGTGLGMAIAKNIIQMMNGSIKVESRLGEGSTFTVSFALKLQTESEAVLDRFADLPVLVVDDDPAVGENACALLDSLTMQSEWVPSGREAVEKTVERHRRGDDYYAVIVDWKMPDMDGLETARAIRQQVGSDVPIIVISAYDWSDIEREARDAGVNGFLSKPLFRSKMVNLFAGLTGDPSAEDGGLAAPLERFDFTGKRVLLVEDNELNSEIAVEILQMSGFLVDTAENGKLGLDQFAASAPGTYDLVLMDVQMPVMNGYEATRAIRALDRPDARTIPIVAMTANAFSTDVRDAREAGMNAHISKPIDVDRVLRVVAEFLKK